MNVRHIFLMGGRKMADAKIEFKLGAISFSGEGDKIWLSTQLDKILDKVPELLKLAPESVNSGESFAGSERAQVPLPKFLKEQNATTKQEKKFLATAVWLSKRGRKTLTAPEISKALKDANQKRLSNAASFLNENINKGFCEKVGNGFFVTEEGMDSL